MTMSVSFSKLILWIAAMTIAVSHGGSGSTSLHVSAIDNPSCLVVLLAMSVGAPECSTERSALEACSENGDVCDSCGSIEDENDLCLELETCCPGCVSRWVEYFTCIDALVGDGSCPALGCAGAGTDCSTTATNALYANHPALKAASDDLGYFSSYFDESFCFTDTSTYTVNCNDNPQTLMKVEEETAFVQACKDAGGIVATQEFNIACAETAPSLSRNGNFKMPACTTSNDCASVSPLVPYASSYERPTENVMGTSCTLTLIGTTTPLGDDGQSSSATTRGVWDAGMVILSVGAFVAFLF